MDYYLDTITLLNINHTNTESHMDTCGIFISIQERQRPYQMKKKSCYTWTMCLPMYDVVWASEKNKSASIHAEYYKIKQTLTVMVICMHEDNKCRSTKMKKWI